MTTKNFKLSIPGFISGEFWLYDNTLDCRGFAACTNCIFEDTEISQCLIQDTHILTPKQVAYLHDNHPEIFI